MDLKIGLEISYLCCLMKKIDAPACIGVAKKIIFIVSEKTSKSRISKRTKPVGLIMMPKLLWRMQAV